MNSAVSLVLRIRWSPSACFIYESLLTQGPSLFVAMAIPKTSRLTLRPFEAEDLDRLTELMAKSDFMRFSQDPYTREQTQTPLEKFLAWNRAGQPSQFSVLFASDSAFIPITGTRESLPKVRAWCVITRSTN
jgi:hypothetical protein